MNAPFAIFLLIVFVTPSFAGGPLQKFNHDVHVERVFKIRKVACGTCHNFSVEDDGGKAMATKNLSSSIFSRPIAKICHDCHNSSMPENTSIQMSCTTCHLGQPEMQRIKPTNHSLVNWRQSHSMEATTEGASCLMCHNKSSCIQCHVRRNDIELLNHGRNFRFTHSISARLEPHRCQTCHTQSFCVSCHLGK